jgi:hypothetical protein
MIEFVDVNELTISDCDDEGLLEIIEVSKQMEDGEYVWKHILVPPEPTVNETEDPVSMYEQLKKYYKHQLCC